ncbi:MAG: hypothetical protein HC804_12470 [Anaerolineae bacterium]|nr:hypothetical protein [Anaerolineae bacterium]
MTLLFLLHVMAARLPLTQLFVTCAPLGLTLAMIVPALPTLAPPSNAQ